MGDVLTQSQIDALLNSVQTEGLEEVQQGKITEKTKYRKYDFHTPKKFTKDRLRLLNSIYENYARVVASYLTSMLRMNCEIELVDVEEQRYYEFNNALTEDDIVAFVRVVVEAEEDAEDEPVMVQMSPSLIYCMIDRMLGGKGEESEKEYENNSGYTDIELALYESVLQYVTPLMTDTWQNYMNLKFSFERIETNPRLIQSVGIDEIVVIITFKVAMKNVAGRMSFSIPGTILEHVFKRFELLNSSLNKRKDHQTKEEKEEIIRGVESSVLELKAQFEEAVISLEDLYSLKTGDILNLNIPKGSDIQLCVEERPWFTGRLGVLKDKVAVKITGSAEVEMEDIILEGNRNE